MTSLPGQPCRVQSKPKLQERGSRVYPRLVRENFLDWLDEQVGARLKESETKTPERIWEPEMIMLDH